MKPSTIAPWLAEPGRQRLREISNVAASRSPYSKDFAASIELDAESLYRLADEFRRHSNVYRSHILRLSSEVLYEIFAFVAAMEPVSAECLGWIRLGHVSHRFRQVLLSMHSLWGSIICDVDPRAWDEVLERAHDASLCFKLEDPGDKVVDPLRIEYMADNFGRARSIMISEFNPRVSLWRYPPEIIAGFDFPELEVLSVVAIRDPLTDDYLLATEFYAIEPIRAPKLRTVSLTNVCIPFPPDNLTSLTLKRVQFYADKPLPNDDDILPSPEALLDVLRRCVNVSHLHLEHMIPDMTVLPPHEYYADSIRLPALKTLKLNAKLSRLVSLWYHISIPADTIINFEVDFTTFPLARDSYVDEGRLLIFPLLSDHFSRSNRSEANALYIGMGGWSKTTCTFLRRDPSRVPRAGEDLPTYIEGAPTDHEQFVDVCFHQCYWENDVSFSHLVASIPIMAFAGIDTLHLDHVHGRVLLCLLARLPLLHTLCLVAPDRASLKLLSPFANYPTSPHSVNVNMPALKHLRLSQARLCVDRLWSSTLQPCIQSVLDVISSRRGAAYPLHTLKLDQLRLDNEDYVDSFTLELALLVLGNVEVTLFGR